MNLFYVPLTFQPKKNNWIFHHSTGYLKCTNILVKSVLLLDLSNVPRNIFSHYKHLFYQRSRPGFRVTLTLATAVLVWLICGSWKSRNIRWSKYDQSQSPKKELALNFRHHFGQITTKILHELFCKKLRVMTNRTACSCGNRNGHHNTEIRT